MCICIGIYIPKHSLLNLYNVACMYAFSPDHFYWITNWYTLPRGRLLENNNKLKCRVVESCPIDASSSTKGSRNIEEEKEERFQDSEKQGICCEIACPNNARNDSCKDSPYTISHLQSPPPQKASTRCSALVHYDSSFSSQLQ